MIMLLNGKVGAARVGTNERKIIMLRNDIITRSKTDRKAYELFVLLGLLFDGIKEHVSNPTNDTTLDSLLTNNDDDVRYATSVRNNLISLNEIKFDFFNEVMDFIGFIDKTAVFEREEYCVRDLIHNITAILDKMAGQFSWYKEVMGQPMSHKEVVDLLAYDCDLEDLVRSF